MLGFNLASPAGLIGLLCLSTLAVAAPAGVTPTTTNAEAKLWPSSGKSGHRRAPNLDTNAKRLASGQNLKAPIKRSGLERRYNSAPSTAASTDPAETFTFQQCSSGGDYDGTYHSLSSTSDQDLVDQCAQYAADDAEFSFYIDTSGNCYTGADSYDTQDCSAGNFAIYSTPAT